MSGSKCNFPVLLHHELVEWQVCNIASLTSFPHVREHLLSSGDHTLGEVLVEEEESFRLHSARRPYDGVTDLERRELDHDGPFAMVRCRGSSEVDPINLESADLVCWQLQLSLDDLSKHRLGLLPRLAGLLLEAVSSI